MKIGVLVCDYIDEALLPISGDMADMFRRLFAPYDDVQLEVYHVVAGELPPAVNACDAYIISGSSYAAYDTHDWIQALKEFIRQVHEHRRKLVGICFGHQAIAEALGGKVQLASGGWGIGVKHMEILQQTEWMSAEREACDLIMLHQDQVTALPPDAVLLGKTAHCPIAMFAIGDHILAMQAHPELDAAITEAYVTMHQADMGVEDVDTALASLEQETDSRAVADWLVRFLRGEGALNDAL